MLSIIISSVNKEYISNLKTNIHDTIGCNYELLIYPNETGSKGICEIYNLGAAEAKYELLCYMHEDICMLTKNWGRRVVDHFSDDPNLGLLGIAGGDYKSLAPSSWFNFGAPDSFPGEKYINIIQGYKFDQKEPIHQLNNPRNDKKSQVACVDGVWLCTKKSIVQRIQFDEKLLKGFHGYDIDFSLAVGQQYTVAVTFEVLLHHFSEGKSSPEWVKDILKVHKKWINQLPVNLTGLPLKTCLRYEKNFFKNFLNYAQSLGMDQNKLREIIQVAKSSSQINNIQYLKLLWHLEKMKFTRGRQRKSLPSL